MATRDDMNPALLAPRALVIAAALLLATVATICYLFVPWGAT